jgi:amino acid transporter
MMNFLGSLFEDGEGLEPKQLGSNDVYSPVSTFETDNEDNNNTTNGGVKEINKAKNNEKKSIGVVALAVLAFYSVSGGPFGFENVVRAGGPYYALMGFSLFFVWAIPEALVTIEMSIALPESSGSVAWVEASFGPKWAFMKGWLSTLSGIADNSLYPILFIDCFIQLVIDTSDSGENPLKGNKLFKYILTTTLTLILTFLNYRGLDVIGKVAIFICIFSLAPFVMFCLIGVFNLDPTRWLIEPEGGIDGVNWRLLLNTFYWNINFWDSAAAFSGDVKNPVKNYPPGIGMALLLVFLSTFLPILIGTGASDRPYTDWTGGFFVAVSIEIAGPWLGYWMILASSMTSIGMFEAEMSSDAWQVAGMAERGIIPKVFAERNKHGAPKWGIAMSLFGVLIVTVLEFEKVIDLLNLLFCFGQAIEYLAFINLRKNFPNMNRPWMIPLGFYGICIMLTLPLAFSFLILYLSSIYAACICITLFLIGLIVYEILEKGRHENWFEFEDYVPYCSDLPQVSQSESGSSVTTPSKGKGSKKPTGLQISMKGNTYQTSSRS